MSGGAEEDISKGLLPNNEDGLVARLATGIAIAHWLAEHRVYLPHTLYAARQEGAAHLTGILYAHAQPVGAHPGHSARRNGVGHPLQLPTIGGVKHLAVSVVKNEMGRAVFVGVRGDKSQALQDLGGLLPLVGNDTEMIQAKS